jgi:hypothetical protein
VLTTVDLRGTLSLTATDETLSVGLVPSAGLVVRAGAYVSILIARAGIALQGTILQASLVPMLSLNVGPSGKITACFDVSIELRPLQIQLQGRLGYFGCIQMVGAVANCSRVVCLLVACWLLAGRLLAACCSCRLLHPAAARCSLLAARCSLLLSCGIWW